MKKVLALIIPCFNEEDVIDCCYKELSSILDDLINLEKISPNSYISFVDDGSNDKTWSKINALAKNKNARGIKFSKNFGHQNALMAGLTRNIADAFITIDVDLQDDTSIIKDMIDKYLDGNDIVYGIRNNRDVDNFLKRFFAESYYNICNFLGMKIVFNHADFRLMSNKVADSLKSLSGSHIYLRWWVPYLGLSSCNLYYSRRRRFGGTSKYTFFKSLIMGIEGIMSVSHLSFGVAGKYINNIYKMFKKHSAFVIEEIIN